VQFRSSADISPGTLKINFEALAHGRKAPKGVW